MQISSPIKCDPIFWLPNGFRTQTAEKCGANFAEIAMAFILRKVLFSEAKPNFMQKIPPFELLKATASEYEPSENCVKIGCWTSAMEYSTISLAHFKIRVNEFRKIFERIFPYFYLIWIVNSIWA